MDKSTLVSAAIAGLILSTGSMANEKEKAKTAPTEVAEGECHGMNACKGQGACGGKGHACAGKNSCKGMGWLKLSKADCEKQGGTFKE